MNQAASRKPERCNATRPRRTGLPPHKEQTRVPTGADPRLPSREARHGSEAPAAKKPATAKPTQRTTAKATATKATAKKLSAREAAYQVLRASKEPLKVDEILKRIAKKGVVLAGTTPAATFAAVMYTHPEQFEKMAPDSSARTPTT